MPRGWYDKNDVKYIVMKRVVNGKEIAECFDTDADFDKFYEGLKRGEMPTTVAINEYEFREHFEKILKSSPESDILHLALSSQMSVTCANGLKVAAEMNAELEKAGRTNRVYVYDSLSATLAIGVQAEELAKLRDAGMPAAEVVKFLGDYIQSQHGWVIMTDLFHLKRGGRIKPAAAVIGAVLNIRPIIHLAAKGNLAIESKIRGNFKAVKYILSRMEKFGEKHVPDFAKSTVWVVRTSQSELFELVRDSIRSVYPDITIKTGIVGPVVGSHLGCGAVAVLFRGDRRLDLK
jgi:DegV family protein with EDD domain